MIFLEMNKPKIFAFYLPQFHPIPENDEWWGKGFTEWTNVAKAKPLYWGHEQPKIPSDLGFYDLRLPESRAAQAELAKRYGIDAFCYYHYWFGNGKVLLNRPLEEVVASHQPDFPFFVCWANHAWTRKSWNTNAQNNEDVCLIDQEYPGVEDVEKQFNYLLPMFKDERYFKIDGRLCYMIYLAHDVPYIKEYCETFNALARKNGLPGFYFFSNVADESELAHPAHQYMDAVLLGPLNGLLGGMLKQRMLKRLSKILHVPCRVMSYKKASKGMLREAHRQNRIVPVITPNWDHSPRSGYNAMVLHHSTPALWKDLAKRAIRIVSAKPESQQIIMIRAWNEWGEGNYLEPDMKWGRGYLEALKEAIEEETNQQVG